MFSCCLVCEVSFPLALCINLIPIFASFQPRGHLKNNFAHGNVAMLNSKLKRGSNSELKHNWNDNSIINFSGDWLSPEPRGQNKPSKELGRGSRSEKFRKNRIFGQKVAIKVQF